MRAFLHKKSLIVVTVLLASGVFYEGCGLETIVVLSEPTEVFNQQNLVQPADDPQYWYADFQTQERENDSLAGADFLGTEVYYKIYNSLSTLTSQKNTINNLNTSTNNTAAATRMIESYTYQPLKTSPYLAQSVFIPKGGGNQNVRFRLKTYKNSDGSLQYRAAIAYPYANGEYEYKNYDDDGTFDSVYNAAADTWRRKSDDTPCDYDSLQFVVPYRTTNGEERSFDFFDDNDTDLMTNSVPVEGDSDYACTAGDETVYETYYVQLFAVAVALDTSSCANTYSLVLDLGIIPISKE